MARFMIPLGGVTTVDAESPQQSNESFASTEIDFNGARATAETLEFCGRKRIVHWLTKGIELARTHFSAESKIRIFLETDPEDSDEYVILEVSSSRDPSLDLESYFKYAEDWSASVEWPASRLILLDLKTTAQKM